MAYILFGKASHFSPSRVDLVKQPIIKDPIHIRVCGFLNALKEKKMFVCEILIKMLKV